MDSLVPVEPPKPKPVVQEPTFIQPKPMEQPKAIEQPKPEPMIKDLFASEPVVESIKIPKPSEPIKSSFENPVHVPTNPINSNVIKDAEYIETKNTQVNYISDDQFFYDFFNEDD